jgi:hypothetical protein
MDIFHIEMPICNSRASKIFPTIHSKVYTLCIIASLLLFENKSFVNGFYHSYSHISSKPLSTAGKADTGNFLNFFSTLLNT